MTRRSPASCENGLIPRPVATVRRLDREPPEHDTEGCRQKTTDSPFPVRREGLKQDGTGAKGQSQHTTEERNRNVRVENRSDAPEAEQRKEGVDRTSANALERSRDAIAGPVRWLAGTGLARHRDLFNSHANVAQSISANTLSAAPGG
jgi:hypothetical protein